MAGIFGGLFDFNRDGRWMYSKEQQSLHFWMR